MQNFSLLPLSRDFSRPIAWGFSFNLRIFRNNILGFFKIQSGTTLLCNNNNNNNTLIYIAPACRMTSEAQCSRDGPVFTVSRYTAHHIFTVPEPPRSRYYTALFIIAIL